MMKKYYEKPLFEELLLADVLYASEEGDNTWDDEFDDKFDEEDSIFGF